MSGCCVLDGVSVGPLYIRPRSPFLAVAVPSLPLSYLPVIHSIPNQKQTQDVYITSNSPLQQQHPSCPRHHDITPDLDLNVMSFRALRTIQRVGSMLS